MTIIQVSNLPSTVTDAQLDNLKASFSSFGEISSFAYHKDVIHIVMESGGDKAIEALNNQLLESKPIKVEKLNTTGHVDESPHPTIGTQQLLPENYLVEEPPGPTIGTQKPPPVKP